VHARIITHFCRPDKPPREFNGQTQEQQTVGLGDGFRNSLAATSSSCPACGCPAAGEHSAIEPWTMYFLIKVVVLLALCTATLFLELPPIFGARGLMADPSASCTHHGGPGGDRNVRQIPRTLHWLGCTRGPSLLFANGKGSVGKIFQKEHSSGRHPLPGLPNIDWQGGGLDFNKPWRKLSRGTNVILPEWPDLVARSCAGMRAILRALPGLPRAFDDTHGLPITLITIVRFRAAKSLALINWGGEGGVH